MSEVAIQVNGLTKAYKLYSNNKRRIMESLFPRLQPKYKEFKALDNVEFTINKGEIVGIIGKNGSGKSTLLKIITGVLNPTEGSVVVNGRISALLELGAGFNPEYTGIENIYLNGTLNGITREEMSKRIDDIAAFADIGDFIHQPVKNYSSGMFVRLAFAVAVYSDPDILIVDEALAVGDAAFQAKCMARMNQIMKSGATVLFVTHDMNTVKRLCQRCIYLENGIKIMEGPAEELADIYLKKIRASMNEEHTKLDEPESEPVNQVESSEIIDSKAEMCEKENTADYINSEFTDRVKQFREGTGEAEVLDLKLYDESGVETYSYAYDQVMKLRMVVKFNKENDVAVGYHIRDSKNSEILGSSSRRENNKLLHVEGGEVYSFEFETHLPLMEGNYNITLVVSKPVILNRTVVFLDMIENAAVFSVEEDFKCKLWNLVYIKNQLIIKKIAKVDQ